MTAPIPNDLTTATGQQLAAMSTEHSRWLAVTAGAGSGKTWVLSWRYVLLIESGARVSEIVAITFTRKAQQEMAARVAGFIEARLTELEAWAANAPAGSDRTDAERRIRYLRDAREQFFGNRITTIDSFCHTQLQQHALEVGLEPGFEIVIEEDQAEVLSDVIQQVRQRLSSRAGELAVAELRGEAHPGGVTEVDRELGRAAAAYLELHEWLGGWSVDGLVESLFHNDGEFERLLEPWAASIGATVEDLRKEPKAQSDFVAAMLKQANDVWLGRLQEAKLEAVDFDSHVPGLRASSTRDAVDGVCAALRRAIAGSPSDKKCTALLACFSGVENGGSDFKTLSGKLAGGGNAAAEEALEAEPIGYSEATALRGAIMKATKDAEFDQECEERSAKLLLALNTLLPILRQVRATALGGRVTFSDLRSKLFEFITASPERPAEEADAAARSVAEGIRWLMIDEFQDTDPAQWELFSRLLDISRKGEKAHEINLMVVGDSKQSIYGFRGADAAVFGRAVSKVRDVNNLHGSDQLSLHHPVTGQMLTPPGPDSVGWELPPEFQTGIIELAVNFRSAAPPLYSGNALFRQIFGLHKPLVDVQLPARYPGKPARDLLDFDATPQDLLVGPRVHELGEGWVKLVPVRSGRLDDEIDAGESPGEHEFTGAAESLISEADLMAQEVAALLAPGPDSSPALAKSPSDIAVLVMKHDHVDSVRAALGAIGIPYAVTGGDRLLTRQEAIDLIVLLMAIADPGEDLAVLGAMRSPYVGISDQGLVLLLRAGLTPGEQPSHRRINGRWRRAIGILQGTILDATDAERADLGQLSPVDQSAAIRGFEAINRWRTLASEATPSQTLRTILAESGAWAFGAGPNHAQHAANLNQILTMLVLHESRGGSLAQFAERLFSRWQSKSTNAREGKPEEGAGGVQVMTIHQSKGLGFDVVVIPFTDSKGGGSHSSFAFEKAWRAGRNDLPLLAVSTSRMLGDGKRPVASLLLKAEIRVQEIAELRRLLYVAWTRARRGVLMHLGYPIPNKSGPKPVDPEAPKGFSSFIKCALGVSDSQEATSGSLESETSTRCIAELKAGLSQLANLHQSLPYNPKLDAEIAEALASVVVDRFQEPSAPSITAEPRQRAVLATLGELVDQLGVETRLPGAESKQLQEMMSPLWRERDLMGATSEPWLKPRDWSPPKLAAVGIVAAPSRETRTEVGVADTDFGTIVHETIRHHLPGVPSVASADPAETAAAIARRTVAGGGTPGLLDAATRHANNGIAVVNQLVAQARTAGAGTVLSEWGVGHPGLGNRRVDLAIETAPGEWLVVDFKTSDPDLFTDTAEQRQKQRAEYRQQIRAYAQLVADAAESAGRPAKVVRGCLLLTVDGSLGEGSEFVLT